MSHELKPLIHAALHPSNSLEKPIASFPPMMFCRSRQTAIIGDPNASVVFLGNTGDMNNAGRFYYTDRFHNEDVTLFNDAAYGTLLLAQTKPGDRLVLGDYDDFNRLIVGRIQESLASIGIYVTDDVEYTESLDEWLSKNNPQAVSPWMVSDRMINTVTDNPSETTIPNVALYTKNGIQTFCEERGIPTPETLHGRRIRDDETICTEATRLSSHATEFVLSMAEGTGGVGVFMTSKEDLQRTLQDNFYRGQAYTLQERHRVINSPCLRAYIGDDEIVQVGVTMQRVVNGAYSGNVWHPQIENELTATASDYFEVNQKLLKELQKAGVRGDINIDSMLIEDGGGIKTVIRELNARKAFSHPLGRIVEQGSINGNQIKRVHTKYGLEIPLELIQRESFIKDLNQFCDDTTRVVFLTRSPEVTNARTGNKESYGYLVFASTDEASEEKLNQIESQLLRYISSL